jgi:hypothetical protein
VDRARSAARLANGFIFFGGGVDHAGDAWKRIREQVSTLGRSAEDFGGEYVALSGGDLSELAREVEGWRSAGGTHLSVVTMDLGLDSVDAHIDFIASVSDLLSLS